jgi:hypothetical protein
MSDDEYAEDILEMQGEGGEEEVVDSGKEGDDGSDYGGEGFDEEDIDEDNGKDKTSGDDDDYGQEEFDGEEGLETDLKSEEEDYNDDDDFIDNDGESVTSSKASTTGGRTKKKKKKKVGLKKKKKKKKKVRGEDEYDEYEVDPRDRVPDPGMAVRMESARIMSNRFMQRHEVKQQMLIEREKRYRKSLIAKRKKENMWRRKMERSPFLVDQLAENERIDEENRVRLQQEQQREAMLNQRKSKIKNEIILKALAEASDLDGLRKEKRLIAIEEKRLKALLGLEKASGHRKADLMAAQRAERQRKQVQAEYLRAKKREEAIMVRERERELLMEKLNVQEPPAFSYHSDFLGSWPKFEPKDQIGQDDY